MKQGLVLISTIIFILTSFVALYSEDIEVKKDTSNMLVPKPEHTRQTLIINGLLGRHHYRKLDLNDSLSSIVFNNYFSALDRNKYYFKKGDIEYFEKYRYELDDYLKKGDVSLAYQIFKIYKIRAARRIDEVFELIDSGFDFDKKDSLVIDDETQEWNTSVQELDDLWRKIVKSQALNLMLAGKEYDEAAEILTKRYKRFEKTIQQYNSEDVYQLFMNAYTSTFDPHTNYFSPITSENFQINMSLSLEGIGARLVQQIDYTKVHEVVPGGPAFKSKKLFKDDKIIGVAQSDTGRFEDIIGWRLDDVVQLIRGPKGSVVRLVTIPHTAATNAEFDTIRIVRDKIKLEEQSAKSEIIPFDNGGDSYKLGVITVPSFYIDFEEARKGVKDYKSTTRDVKKLIAELKEENIDGLLIDLRHNGGGSLQEAIELTGLFIPHGPVVQIKNSDGSMDDGTDKDFKTYYDGPLAVMINRFSASASEIFSGAIQDYKRGIVVGESTFGKGTVQNLISLDRFLKGPKIAGNSGSNSDVKYGQLKITLAKFYRITGSSTQKRGVQPDIKFPSPYEDENFGESSRDNALPWDKISSTSYEESDLISEEIINRLNDLYLDDLNTDKGLRHLVKNIEDRDRNKDKSAVSLNLQERKREKGNKKEPEEDDTSDIETTTINDSKINDEKLEIEKKLSDDPYLKEGLRILAELTEIEIG